MFLDGDMGHEVLLEAYEVSELRAIVRKSKELLARAGFKVGESFRAGGWLAGPRVHEAIRSEGFTVDSSATDSRWHDELARYRLHSLIAEYWPAVSETTQPYAIDTPAGALLEMPDTGALADYVTASEMEAHLARAAARVGDPPAHTVYAHIGFHQETAAKYVDRIIDAITQVKRLHGELIQFETLGTAARRFRSAAAPR